MRVDVAIVGGGVIGWSTAYHLVELAPSLSVCVFEREASYGMGSTGRAAGGVRAQFGTGINIEFSLYSIREFEAFSAVHGAEIDFRQRGYMFVAATAASDEYLSIVLPLQSGLGVPVRRMTRSEVAMMAPYIETSDVMSGSFSPTDGYLDPFAVCSAYERSARRLGAHARYNHSVSTFEQLEAEIVVIAAGHESRRFAATAGLDVPVQQAKHQLAMTGPMPQLPRGLPMVVDLATTFHFRSEGQGILIGYDDPQADKHDTSYAFDFSFLEHMAEPGMRRLPCLAEAGFDAKQCWAGFYAETPDGHAILDRDDRIILATGFGGHGIMHSPAAGRAAAELALFGRCDTFDLRPLRLSRFAEGDLSREPMRI